MRIAQEIAEEMSAIGLHLNDPRPRGIGMGILGWIALFSDDYEKALNYANESLRIPLTPQERTNALGVKGAALTLLRRLDEAKVELSNTRKQYIELELALCANGNRAGIWCFGGFEWKNRKGNSYY